MSKPDFQKGTIDTIAKRAGYICSNPDCRVQTVGPNSQAEKSTTIGEAAHISGARANSKRFDPDMTDWSRSAITNAIWLCRNCHKLIDSDDEMYPSHLLFEWRELHEQFVLSRIGTKTDQLRYEYLQGLLEPFDDYPAIIRRTIIDKPDGWEYQLTAGLLRYLNNPYFRQLDDLDNGLYTKSQSHIEETQAYNWIASKLAEFTQLIAPSENLIAGLSNSWVKPNEEEKVREIHHVCHLIRDQIVEVIAFEESIHFTHVPERFVRLKSFLENIAGSQIQKLKTIPDKLDGIVAIINDPKTSNDEKQKLINENTEMIVFELPDNWNNDFNRELKKIHSVNSPNGCFSLFMLSFFIFLTIIISTLVG